MQKLTREEAQKLLDNLMKNLPREECRNCDCLQGFLVQLELDAIDDISDLTNPLKVSTSEMHGCLGCDPCPPGAEYAEYLRNQQNEAKE